MIVSRSQILNEHVFTRNGNTKNPTTKHTHTHTQHLLIGLLQLTFTTVIMITTITTVRRQQQPTMVI